MSEFVKMFLSLSLSGTLLLFSVLFLKNFYKNVFSRCWQYYILLLVALKFLLPVSFNYNIITVNLTEQENLPDKESIKEITEETKKEPDKEIDKAELIKEVKETQADISNGIKQNIKNTINNIAFYNYVLNGIKRIYKYFFYIWFVIVISLIVHKISIYQGFKNYIQKTGTPIQDIDILNLFAECGERLGINQTIELYCSQAVSSPVLTGFFHPYIIIPVNHIEDKNLFYVFLHELVHYKRKDIFYKWFVQIIICIHWFNPFVYLLGREVNKACELSCDEKVISLLDKNKRKEYGDTLLSFVQTKETHKNPLGTVTLSEGAKQLKERLGAIMYFKKKSGIIKIATVIVTIIICFNFALAGAYAARNSINSGNSILKQEDKEDIENINNIEDTKSTTLKGRNSFEEYYRQRSFYINSYVFEIGWDLRESEAKLYNYKAKVKLKDNSDFTVYFDDSVKKYCKDKSVINAAGKLIDYIKKIYTGIKVPLIMRVTYINTNDIPDYAEKYYKNGDLTGFIALFPELNQKEKSNYLNRMYNSDKIEYFGAVAENIDRDMLLTYLDKSSKGSENLNFFSVLLSYAKYSDIKYYIKKSYKSNDIARFSILSGYLSVKDKKKWRTKAKKNNKTEFYEILANK